MATRIRGSEPITAPPQVGQGLSGATTGNKMIYSCPANKQAVVRFASMSLTNLAPTVALQATINSVTFNITSAAASFALSCFITLNTGDAIALNVTAAIAASTFDGFFGIEEYPVS